MLILALFLPTYPGWAGQVSKAKLEQHLKKRFGGKYVLGEPLTDPPAWPLFESGDSKRTLVAWLFESNDVEKVRGYSGKPINMLITLRPDGRFMDVVVVKHYEPLFKSRSGMKEIVRFVDQYKDLTINHEIQILDSEATPTRTKSTASLHGIARGTVTASAIDRTVMWAAVQVAEAHLDSLSDEQAKALADGAARRQHRRLDWATLKEKGLVRQIRHSYGELYAAFKQAGEAVPEFTGQARSANAAVDYWMIPIALAPVGRSLLEPRAWQILQRKIRKGRQLILTLDASKLALGEADEGRAGPGIVPMVRQSGRDYPLERTQFTARVRPDDGGSGKKVAGTARLFQTAADSGFDITKPFSMLSQPIFAGAVHPRAALEDEVSIADMQVWAPRAERPAWLNFWVQKRTELIVLGIGLVILTAGLIAQKRLSMRPRTLAWFRNGYLLFTLVFVGWYAQGQLTVVTIIAALQAFMQGEGVGFMMADPMAVVLWAFTLLTLFIWGRGTFCGWLCPFGAFQELINNVATRLGLRRRQLHTKVNKALRGLKYVVLAVLVLMAVTASPLLDSFVEVEPFKTAISMNFQRAWPYVVWALACLALSLLVYRGYCRYLCPLGAALALLGRVRLFNWIPRREACGTPCQTCRFRCTYQAIDTAGKVAYSECFQCLDCVSIYQDDHRCMPLIVERKRSAQRTIPIKAHA